MQLNVLNNSLQLTELVFLAQQMQKYAHQEWFMNV